MESLKGQQIIPESIGDKTYTVLKNLIIQSKLSPGMRLKEEVLSSMLELSRTPLREALKRLQDDGWVTRIPGGGVKVSDISQKEVEELYQIREVLEGLMAREATNLLKEDDLSRLEELIQKMEMAAALNDSQLVIDYGHKFHDIIYEKANNQKCLEILRNVLDHIERYRYLGVDTSPGRRKKAGDEHRQLLNALITGKGNKVEQVMREHIRYGGQAVLESIDKWLSKRSNG